VVRARFRVPFIALVSTILLLGLAAPALAGYFIGTRGDDNLRGTNRADEMYGLRGWDDIFGRDGKDYIEGGTGHDRLFGGDNADDIYGGQGADDLDGGRGDDFLNAADDKPDDEVDCGAGVDVVVFDTGDDVDAATCP
jgi:Ca2+-binding RTX toxin-like protein